MGLLLSCLEAAFKAAALTLATDNAETQALTDSQMMASPTPSPISKMQSLSPASLRRSTQHVSTEETSDDEIMNREEESDEEEEPIHDDIVEPVVPHDNVVLTIEASEDETVLSPKKPKTKSNDPGPAGESVVPYDSSGAPSAPLEEQGAFPATQEGRVTQEVEELLDSEDEVAKKDNVTKGTFKARATGQTGYQIASKFIACASFKLHKFVA